MSEIISGIYQIVNLVNGKKYVGSSVHIIRRWKHHIDLLSKNKHHSPYLQSSWNKYGQDAFSFQIIQKCECVKEILIEREQHYIDTLKPEYNVSLTAGSVMGIKHSAETIKKMSSRMLGNQLGLGYKHTEDSKQKISYSKIGIPRSVETKRKMSVTKKGKPSKKRGTHCTEETKKKISESMKSHLITQETKDKISASLIARFNKEKLNP